MDFTTNSQRILFEIFKQEFEENNIFSNESRFFEFFAAKQVLKINDFSDEEVEAGILGNGNDGGCDGVYVLHNGILVTEDSLHDLSVGKDSSISLIIVQAKRTTSFCEDSILKWKTIASNLLEIGIDDSLYSKRYNEDVLNVFRVFRELYVKLLRVTPNLTVSFYYSTFATQVHPNVQQQAEELKHLICKQFPSPKTVANVYFWDAQRLLSAVQTQPNNKFNLSFVEAPIGERRDFVALVNLEKFFRFITDENGMLLSRIFESNIRDYQGHNSVNQDIQETLEAASSEDFWWLNNGITILADEATLVTRKEIVLTAPSIVNGLQTSNEIFNYFCAMPEKRSTERRNVLVRIIIPESEASRDRIILATNNQTNIPKSSLRANDPIHWQIEQFFKGRGLYYDRRKNYYKNLGKNSAEIVSVSFLAQCMMSLLLQKPDYARARPSTLLSKDDTYKRLYVFNQDLDAFYNAAKLGKIIDRHLKMSQEYSTFQKNDIVFYILYYSVATHLKKAIITEQDLKELNIDDFKEMYIAEIAKRVFHEYQELGGNGKVAKGTGLINRLIELASAFE